MSHDEIIEQDAQMLSTFTTCDGRPWATELHRRQARPLPGRGEVIDLLKREVWPFLSQDPEGQDR